MTKRIILTAIDGRRRRTFDSQSGRVHDQHVLAMFEGATVGNCYSGPSLNEAPATGDNWTARHYRVTAVEEDDDAVRITVRQYSP